MGTDGGSEADPGRGTHRRRRLTHTLEHKPRAHNCSNYCKKKKFFLGLLAVLSCREGRLDAATIAFILDHGEAKVLLTDTEFAPVIKEALALTRRELIVIDVDDSEASDWAQRAGERDRADETASEAEKVEAAE